MTDALTVPRADANRLAMKVARAVLDAAHDFEFSFDGVPFKVAVEREPAEAWPVRGVEGITEGVDGPWPGGVRCLCTWPTGRANLVVHASIWRSGEKGHLVYLAVTVASTRRRILWITLTLPLRTVPDGASGVIAASISPFRRPDDQDDMAEARTQTARSILARSGLPLLSDSRAEACRVAVPGGEVLPSPREAFERLTQITILKLPLFLRDAEGVEGTLPFDATVVATAGGRQPDSTAPADGKRAGIWPLPGGVRQYESTFQTLLNQLVPGPLSVQAFNDFLRERYEVSGATARKGYLNLLSHLGVADVAGGLVTITAEGRAYLAEPDSIALFELLHRAYTGMLETLVITEMEGPVGSEAVAERLRLLLDVDWASLNQSTFRRNWLLSLGLTDRVAAGDTVTARGREVLERHAEAVSDLRRRLDENVDALGPQPEEEEEEENEAEVEPGFDAPPPLPRERPSAWGADRVDLRPEMVDPHTRDLELPGAVVASATAALSAGKHLLLVGPPGTGKTKLAHALVRAAAVEGYCADAWVATASADWTTFDTIGGYALQRSGELRFRSGAMLRAIERCQWLVIDELNRADIDRSFGELMTVLSGETSDTAFELDDGRTVRIGPDPRATHPVPRTFRLLATMNTWDKTSLFKLSYAVQRRFAIVHVGVPEDAAFSGLIRRHTSGQGVDPPLDERVTLLLVRLFSRAGLFGVRVLGPAVVLDLLRFVRRRIAVGGIPATDAVAEALPMYVLPQLEGLNADEATRARGLALDALGGDLSAPARGELTERFRDLFPHARFAP